MPFRPQTKPDDGVARLHRLPEQPEAGDTEMWQPAARYELNLPGPPGSAREPGFVSFGWNDSHLVARYVLVDRVITTEADRDNQLHYELGDTVEWFIKPADQPLYWEFYATPNGYRTAMLWAEPWARRRGVIHYIEPDHVAVNVGRWDGSQPGYDFVGNPDLTGWWAELSVGRDLLESNGSFRFDGQRWASLASRYNHRADQPDPADDPTRSRRQL